MKKLGVVVARFQVPMLHGGHLHLLQEVAKDQDALLIILGHKVNQPDTKNPLSLRVRQAMVRQALAHLGDGVQVILGDLEDSPVSNEVWSESLDEQIESHKKILENSTGDTVTVCLYGSRDSFLAYYHGVHPSQIVSEVQAVSGTEVRKKIFSLQEDDLTDEQREGIVYAFKNVYPVGMSVVDILLYKKEKEKTFVLLGRKKREIEYRILGGFFDVDKDMSLEDAALRELREEAGDIQTQGLRYVMSKKVDDWRYRDNQHKIVSSLFIAEYVSGNIFAKDDIEEVQWFEVNDDLIGSVTKSHHEFVRNALTQIS